MDKTSRILAAIVSFPAIVLEEIMEFFSRVEKDEEQVMKGTEDAGTEIN